MPRGCWQCWRHAPLLMGKEVKRRLTLYAFILKTRVEIFLQVFLSWKNKTLVVDFMYSQLLLQGDVAYQIKTRIWGQPPGFKFWLQPYLQYDCGQVTWPLCASIFLIRKMEMQIEYTVNTQITINYYYFFCHSLPLIQVLFCFWKREWKREEERESQADSLQRPKPDTGLHLRTQRSWLEPKPRVRLLTD